MLSACKSARSGERSLLGMNRGSIVSAAVLAGCVAACSGDAPASGGGAAPGGSAGAASAGTAVSIAGMSAAGASGSASGSTAVAGSGNTSAGVGVGGNAGVSAGGVAGTGMSPGGSGGAGASLPRRVLLYHFSTLVIESVPAQLSLIEAQLEQWGYEVEDSVKPEDLNAANLARFSGIGMINTCFEPFGAGKLGAEQTTALTTFVDNGGGLFGTHCAAVTFQAAEPPHAYNGLIGGRGGHGFFDGKSVCRTTESHVVSQLPATFHYTGNLDNADYLAADSKVLVKCQWSGGDLKDTAVSWIRTPGKGRVFYTNFAKVDADLSDATLGQKHIWLGLGWVLGR